MTEPRILEFSLNDLTEEAKNALTDLQFEMYKSGDVAMWMSCIIHASATVHKLKGLDVGDLMDFHLSVFMSAVLSSPDCEAKNNLINAAIELLNTNRPPKGPIQ